LTETIQKNLELLFTRRTIRRFKSTSIAEADIRRIVEAGQRAPSACNLQTYTIIWINNIEKRRKVLDVCGVPSLTAPVVFIVCADLRRLAKTLDNQNYDHCLKHGNGHSLKLLSIMDASLAAENMTIAAEGYGLGSLFIGSALANRKLTEILKLPKGVLPLTLLCIGHPDEKPPKRPRLPLSSILQLNEYQDPSSGEIKSFLEHMNQALEEEGYYRKYANRKAPYNYGDHIRRKTDPKTFKQEDKEIEEVMKKTGFLLGEALDS